MATYNAESAPARLLAIDRHFLMDEARGFLGEAFNTSGDLEMAGSRLIVRFDPLVYVSADAGARRALGGADGRRGPLSGHRPHPALQVKDAPGVA